LALADLRGAFARLADFAGDDLAYADLTGADFDGAILHGVSLYKARLSGTRLSRSELGNAILQEDPDDLRAFFCRINTAAELDGIDQVLRTRQLEEARQVYASLRSNFIEIGNLEDASWAHIKERQMAKRTHSPQNARCYFGDELADSRPLLSVRWWRFYLQHTAKWLLDWMAELACGYGERPLRPAAWAIAVLVVFPFLFAWSGGITKEGGSLTLLDYYNYSFGAFTTIGFGHFQASTPLAQTLTSIEALLGISIVALLMFALGNRISRS
jgi:hypothetical protein